MSWSSHGFRTLGALQLAATLLVFVVIIIGFAGICTSNPGLMILFIILSILSALCSLGIAIFCFIGTQTRYWNDYVGCDAKYDGYLSMWNSVDNYLYAVDSLLCSDECPCYFNDVTTSLYASNTSTSPYYNLWKKDNKTTYAKRFQDCSDVVIAEAKNEYLYSNAYYNHTFNDKWFRKYYKHIEEKFHCVGFCGTTYYNTRTHTNAKIVKYLFSDLTKGIPEHFGCVGDIMNWLRKTVNAFAACALVMFVIQFILFILALLLLCTGKDGLPTMLRLKKKMEEEARKQKISEQNKQNNEMNNIEQNKQQQQPQKQEQEPLKNEASVNKKSEMSYNIPRSQEDEIDIRFNPSTLNQ